MPIRTLRVPNKRSGNYGTSYDVLLAESIVGTPVKDWKRRIQLGQSASSAYSATRYRLMDSRPLAFTSQSVVLQPGSNGPFKEVLWGNYSQSGFLLDLSSRLGFISSPVISPSASDINKAAARLHKLIREDRSATNGLLFLGELRETIGMLRSPFAGARKAVLGYVDTLKSQVSTVKRTTSMRKSESPRALSIRRARALKDGMASAWLELQFGLKPFLSDVTEISQALTDAVSKFDRQVRYSTRASSYGYSLDVSSDGTIWQNAKASIRMFRRTEASVQYVAIYRRRLTGSPEFFGRLAESTGFTLENFVPTIYELAPWSFLVDYFVNLGSIIECSTTSTDGLVTCVETKRTVTRTTVTERAYPYNEGLFVGAVNSKFMVGKVSSLREFDTTIVNRVVKDALPIPSLQFSVPGWDSLKWANMAALLSSTQTLNRSLFRF